VGGGILCGLLVAGAILLLAGRTSDHLIETTFTTVAAYGSFLLAEHFHLSGVLACLTAGLLIGNVGHLGSFSDKGHEMVGSFGNFWPLSPTRSSLSSSAFRKPIRILLVSSCRW